MPSPLAAVGGRNSPFPADAPRNAPTVPGGCSDELALAGAGAQGQVEEGLVALAAGLEEPGPLVVVEEPD